MVLLIEMIRRFVGFILILSTALPVAEEAALTNRKKYRAVRSAPSEQCDYISDRAKMYAENAETKVLIKNYEVG